MLTVILTYICGKYNIEDAILLLVFTVMLDIVIVGHFTSAFGIIK